MTEWWQIALLISWPLAGLATWLMVVVPERRVRTGDIGIFPVIVLFGWVSFVIWLITNADSGRTWWEW